MQDLEARAPPSPVRAHDISAYDLGLRGLCSSRTFESDGRPVFIERELRIYSLHTELSSRSVRYLNSSEVD
jgi:hypothetical protein